MRETGDLIARLAAEGAAPGSASPAARLCVAALAGAGASALGAMALGARPDVLSLAPDAATLGKAAFGAVVALCAGALASRLASPGQPVLGRLAALTGAALLFVALASGQGAAPAAMGAACATSIALLSLPALGAALLALGRRAVLRPGAAGAAAGLMAGATGLAGFALHCPAGAVLPMLGWYALAFAALAALGALAGTWTAARRAGA